MVIEGIIIIAKDNILDTGEFIMIEAIIVTVIIFLFIIVLFWLDKFIKNEQMKKKQKERELENEIVSRDENLNKNLNALENKFISSKVKTINYDEICLLMTHSEESSFISIYEVNHITYTLIFQKYIDISNDSITGNEGKQLLNSDLPPKYLPSFIYSVNSFLQEILDEQLIIENNDIILSKNNIIHYNHREKTLKVTALNTLIDQNQPIYEKYILYKLFTNKNLSKFEYKIINYIYTNLYTNENELGGFGLNSFSIYMSYKFRDDPMNIFNLRKLLYNFKIYYYNDDETNISLLKDLFIYLEKQPEWGSGVNYNYVNYLCFADILIGLNKLKAPIGNTAIQIWDRVFQLPEYQIRKEEQSMQKLVELEKKYENSFLSFFEATIDDLKNYESYQIKLVDQYFQKYVLPQLDTVDNILNYYNKIVFTEKILMYFPDKYRLESFYSPSGNFSHDNDIYSSFKSICKILNSKTGNIFDKDVIIIWYIIYNKILSHLTSELKHIIDIDDFSIYTEKELVHLVFNSDKINARKHLFTITLNNENTNDKSLYFSDLIDLYNQEIEINNLKAFEENLSIENDDRINIEELLIRIDFMDGYEFEAFITELYSKLKYSAVNTKGSGDQGVDVLVTDNLGYKTGIQVKRSNSKVSNRAVQEIFSGINYYSCQNGIVITNNFFTNSAIDLAARNNIELINRTKLRTLIKNAYSNDFYSES